MTHIPAMQMPAELGTGNGTDDKLVQVMIYSAQPQMQRNVASDMACL